MPAPDATLLFIAVLLSPLGNEKILTDLSADERLWVDGKRVPILLDTCQKLDRRYKAAWQNMLGYCDDAVTGGRGEWESKDGFIYACPCFGHPRTGREKRNASRMKQVKKRLAKVGKQEGDMIKLDKELERLAAEREQFKEIRSSYYTGWNIRSKAHREIQEGVKKEADTDIFIRCSSCVRADKHKSIDTKT